MIDQKAFSYERCRMSIVVRQIVVNLSVYRLCTVEVVLDLT